MTCDDDLLQRLAHLREQVDILLTKPRFSEEFATWHKQFVAIAEECFDQDSAELASARSIRFETPPELLDNARSKVDELSKREPAPGNALSEFLQGFELQAEKLQENSYRKALLDARELISTMIYTRTQKK